MATALAGRPLDAAETSRPVPHRGKRPFTALDALRVAVTLIVPLLACAWLTTEKTVLLQVDGHGHRVVTHAESVAELLDRSGLAVGPTDRVVPAPATALADGMVVEFVAGRDVTVVVDGQPRELVVPALRAEDVLAQAGLGGDLLNHAPFARVYDGMLLEVGVPVEVMVSADGLTREVTAPHGLSVGDLLDRLDLALDADDRVTPPPSAVVTAGAEVVVQRVHTTVESHQVTVPAPVTERENADLPAGEERELTPGLDGTKHVVETVTWVDGVAESRVLSGEILLTEPQARVVEVGTASDDPVDEPSETPSEEPTEEPSDEGSEPVEEESDGEQVQTGEASWYVYGDEYTAAHRTLPKGTVVTVTNLANGKSVEVTINDRGPYIDGRIIDLNKVAFEELADPSVGVIDVRVTW